MSEHTQGPWEINVDGDPYVQWGGSTYQYVVWAPDEDYRNRKADARLIAAAPDMYEFIRQINREVGIVGNESLFYATNALIAKVRGE